jgi:hypothetical protein
MSATTIFNVHLPGGTHGPPLAIILVCSIFGLRLLFKGIRGEILDECGMEKAPRWLYIASGVVLQMPAFLYAYAVKAAN